MSYVDKFLLKDTIQISKQFGIKTFIETGTLDGRSPRILEPYFDKIYSCEVDNKFFNEQGKFIGSDKLVPNEFYPRAGVNGDELFFSNTKFKIIQKSSPEALPEFFDEIGHDNFILYLDAHWHGYWPLLDELKVCVRYSFRPVIIIHDFDIKHPSKFGYDEYNGNICGLDYVRYGMDEVYGVGEYLHMTNSDSDINRGVGFFIPKDKVFTT